jgi:cell division protein FtsB
MVYCKGMAYGNRSLTKRLVSSPISLVLAAVLFVVLAKGVWTIHLKAAASSARLEEAHAELVKLQARQTDLSKKVEYLSTNEGIEAEIRTKYRAVHEGESVAVIIDPADQTANSANASSTSSNGFWHKLFHIFGL